MWQLAQKDWNFSSLNLVKVAKISVFTLRWTFCPSLPLFPQNGSYNSWRRVFKMLRIASLRWGWNFLQNEYPLDDVRKKVNFCDIRLEGGGVEYCSNTIEIFSRWFGTMQPSSCRIWFRFSKWVKIRSPHCSAVLWARADKFFCFSSITWKKLEIPKKFSNKSYKGLKSKHILFQLFFGKCRRGVAGDEKSGEV